MKKTFLWILFALLSGTCLGFITFDKYDKNLTENTFKLDSSVYALYYNTYINEDEMHKNINDIERYIYLTSNNETNVYLAVSKTKSNIEKLKKIYDNKNIKTIIKSINIDNDEFIQNLNEYEKLIDVAENENTLLVIENQILSCYEKMVLADE